MYIYMSQATTINKDPVKETKKKNNDECIELKNIKYQTMLINNKMEINQKKETTNISNIEDFLNKERGLTRKDGKKVVKKSSAPKAPPPAPNRGKKKIVSSLKVSRSGIDGGASQVNKAKKKVVKKNVMSTKTPKTFQGTNITPTKLQRDRMRKRAMGST